MWYRSGLGLAALTLRTLGWARRGEALSSRRPKTTEFTSHECCVSILGFWGSVSLADSGSQRGHHSQWPWGKRGEGAGGVLTAGSKTVIRKRHDTSVPISTARASYMLMPVFKEDKGV